MSPVRDSFIEKFKAALDSGTFVKLTLSDPCGEQPGLRNVYVRMVELTEGRRLSVVHRFATRDITKNHTIPEGVSTVGSLLGSEFRRGHLFTTAGDWQIDMQRGKLKRSKPAFAAASTVDHDRKKSTALGAAPWLAALGVTDLDGVARSGMADKLRQIERFTTLLGHLLDESTLREAGSLRVLDLAAGKGYLTFAMHGFFLSRGIRAEVTGVEMRPELVEFTTGVARDLACHGLKFKQAAIHDFKPDAPPDVLIALHACDTATDDALHLGVVSGSRLVVAAPCCHKEIRTQLAPPTMLRDVLRHGILAEREAEIVTDGIRALLLEIHGWKSSVFEFISPEHTGKNLMIAAHKRSQPAHDVEALRARLRELLQFYGIRTQRLARLLGESE